MEYHWHRPMYVPCGVLSLLTILVTIKSSTNTYPGILQSQPGFFIVDIVVVVTCALCVFWKCFHRISSCSPRFRETKLVINCSPVFFFCISTILSAYDYIEFAYFHMLLHPHPFQRYRYNRLPHKVPATMQTKQQRWKKSCLYAYANHRCLNSTKSVTFVGCVSMCTMHRHTRAYHHFSLHSLEKREKKNRRHAFERIHESWILNMDQMKRHADTRLTSEPKQKLKEKFSTIFNSRRSC